MRPYSVTLIAQGIQVTADEENQAERYALSDAREFRGEWDFQQTEAGLIRDAQDVDLTEDADDVEPDVALVDGPDGDLWTYEASFELTVEANSPIEAIATAKAVLKR